jgi:hypothetical protein
MPNDPKRDDEQFTVTAEASPEDAARALVKTPQDEDFARGERLAAADATADDVDPDELTTSLEP